MRIINGYDYYDAANFFSHEPVYVRRNFTVKDAADFPTNPHFLRVLDFHRAVYVIFCGVLYSGIEVLLGSYGKYKKSTIWDFDTYKKQKDNKQYSAIMKNYFTPIDCRDFCIRRKITIAIGRSRIMPPHVEWILEPYGIYGDSYSPSLKGLDFYKVIPPQQACQEIEMWIGGVLTNNPDPPQIVDEKIRIAKRGFDSKTSFRKKKQK